MRYELYKRQMYSDTYEIMYLDENIKLHNNEYEIIQATEKELLKDCKDYQDYVRVDLNISLDENVDNTNIEKNEEFILYRVVNDNYTLIAKWIYDDRGIVE